MPSSSQFLFICHEDIVRDVAKGFDEITHLQYYHQSPKLIKTGSGRVGPRSFLVIADYLMVITSSFSTSLHTTL